MGGAVLVQGSGEDRAVERLQLRVEGAAGGELSTQDGVLKQKRRQQSGRDRQELGPQILDLPFQLHPSVLKPRFHLKSATQPLMLIYVNKFSLKYIKPRLVKINRQVYTQTNLSFGEVELLSDLSPLCSAQVLVLAEGALQLADLLGGELGPQPSLLCGFAFAVISHLALGSRRVTAAVWVEEHRS